MMGLRISCCLPPSKDAPSYARLAEELGYACVFLYDSPALYGDIWMSLARMADATSRIGLGLGVSVPSLRHPLAIASAIASLEELASGRVTYGFGAGFTARYTMGQKPLRWADMRLFFLQLRALLRGETVEIDGGVCQMIHSPGFAPRRPIEVPLLAAASGPKGYEVAREVADGVFCDRAIPRGFARCLQYTFGTVLEPGEDHTSERVQAAAGPFATTAYHAVWQYGAEQVDAMPGGAAWRSAIEKERPEGQRHLATHEGHLVAVTERDRALIKAAGALMTQIGWTGDAESIRRHLSESAAAGATEIVMSMAGPDIPRELRAFAQAAGLARRLAS